VLRVLPLPGRVVVTVEVDGRTLEVGADHLPPIGSVVALELTAPARFLPRDRGQNTADA
jgi:hypothetical protein